MTITADVLIDGIGVFVGLLFMYLYARVSHTLVGSAFKRYHEWMTVGTGLFMLAFIVDYANIVSAGIPWLDFIHNVLLVVAVVVFTMTTFSLPREASKYVESETKAQRDNEGPR